MKREESQSCYTPVYAALLGCFLLLCLSSCDKLGLEPKATNTPTNIDTLSDVEINQASEKLFAAGAQAIEETILSAKTLNEHVLAFLDQPQQGSLETAQESWLAVALAYQKFAYARQFGLLQPDIFAQLNKLDYHIGSYPIQPGFIDAFGPYKYSGLVFDAGLPITRESLAHQQGLTDIEEVVLGIYAIDFMLYNVDGRRRSEDYSASNTLTKAQRDYGYQAVNELPNQRRRELLSLQTTILVEELEALLLSWQSDSRDSVSRTQQTLDPLNQQSLAQKAIARTLTQALLKIGELHITETNADEIETSETVYTEISRTLVSNTLEVKQGYLRNTLSSVSTGLLFFENDVRHQLELLVSQTEETLAVPPEDTATSAKEYWSEIFSNFKEIATLVTTTTQTERD